MSLLKKFEILNRYRSNNPGADRIASELSYLKGISGNNGGSLDKRIEEALDGLLSCIERDGTVTSAAAMEAERSLMDLEGLAKSYTLLFLAHAHIDMDWKWGYNETAAVTIDTFRTVLDLMRQFPGMTFCQSQATTYEIVEKYRPEMLSEIKQRIREGRWEVTAAEWVEPDKNMPDGESLTRQILQAKKYMSRLLDISPKSLDLDFVPDSFGHNLNVPEILANAGVRYLYHYRAHQGPRLYRYVAPSGKDVLAYCEYTATYGHAEISPYHFEIIPDFCKKEKMDTCLCLYGVSDHGGGPSRRDVKRITEYMSWPLAPTIRFGTMHEFFKAVERCRTSFPEIRSERNFVFTGCYTTQARIKMANRISEIRMNEVEALSASASLLTDAPREPERLDAAWRMLLFNQFHDILPGSGTIETREHAMGRFQDLMADVRTYGDLSMRRIADAIDTASLPFLPEQESFSEGAGVGFYQAAGNRFQLSAAERGNGPFRAFHLFNPSGFDRSEVTEITVWDYPADLGRAVLTDDKGNEIPFVSIRSGEFWTHTYSALLFPVTLPGFSYATFTLSQREGADYVPPYPSDDDRSDNWLHDGPITLENDKIRAVFDKRTCRLLRLTDLETGETLIDKPSCFFRYAEENALYQMTAWRVGPLMKIVDLNETNVPRFSGFLCNPLISEFVYSLKFGSTTLKCVVSLKRGSRILEFDTTIDWNEPAEYRETVPQISFAVPVSYKTTGNCYCDIPYGEIKRPALMHDVPALSHLTVEGVGKTTVSLICDTKYGYRLQDDTASVTLIRSAFEPDPYPDRGVHNIRIGVACCGKTGVRAAASAFCRPLPFLSATPHTGTLPLSGTVLTVEGDAEAVCLKNSEDGTGAVVRLCQLSGRDNSVTLGFSRAVKKAFLADSLENPIKPAMVSDKTVTIELPAYAVTTVVVRFD